MKKITLLFTLLCVSALNGMESPEQDNYKGLGGLSPEIQMVIIKYLKTYDNLDDIINAIKATSLVDKELNDIINAMYGKSNPAGFQSLVYKLAQDFAKFYAPSIAEKFGTPTAKRYLQVLNGSESSKKMVLDVKPLSTVRIKEFIHDGADVNYFDFYGVTPMLLALQTGRPLASIQLLLEVGANPNVTDNKNKGVFEYLDSGYPQKFKIYRIQKPKIKKLLEEAMKKEQQ